MKKEDLKISIEQLTLAIKLITECKGYSYDKAHKTTQLIIEQRRKLEKELKRIELIQK